MDINDCFCQKPVLQSPKFDLPFRVQTNASDVELGAVLRQGEKVVNLFSIWVASCFLGRPNNLLWSKKCWPLDTLRYYIIEKEFALGTVYRAFQWFQRMKDSIASITHCALSLQPFKLEDKYRAKAQNVIADFLPCRSEEWQSLGIIVTVFRFVSMLQ